MHPVGRAVEKPIDFWLRKGKAVGETKPTEKEVALQRTNAHRLPNAMGKVFFDPGIESVRGILIGTDPYYLRRYPARNGGVMHIVQARPDRSGHTPSEAEAANRIAFGIAYGKERHREYLERTMKGQLEIEFID